MSDLLCTNCEDTGHVCEAHPYLPWGGICDSRAACNCGGAGMPCPSCCIEIPQDGTHSITRAFVPLKDRGA